MWLVVVAITSLPFSSFPTCDSHTTCILNLPHGLLVFWDLKIILQSSVHAFLFVDIHSCCFPVVTHLPIFIQQCISFALLLHSLAYSTPTYSNFHYYATCQCCIPMVPSHPCMLPFVHHTCCMLASSHMFSFTNNLS